MDKSMRSVFVGNIPYDATEDALKDVFTEVGPVLSMKLVYDRESGKPKGYGFCEYKDQETALSAMRNLNGYVFGGRALRVDNACTEKSRMEMAALLQLPQTDSPYGEQCLPDEAPEVITNMVASFPPERVHEVLEQLQNAARRDPNETRETLLKNPQLCYAALQMLVMRGILDPAAAVNFLLPCSQPRHMGVMGFPMGGDSRMSVDMHVPPMDPRFGRYGLQQQQQQHPPQSMGPSAFPVDPRHRINNDPRMDRPFGNFGAAPGGPPAGGPGLVAGLGSTPLPANLANIGSHGMHLDAGGGDVSDQEKASLIMQVLQLSDEQIALLPPEQRASILVLKEQLLRNSQR